MERIVFDAIEETVLRTNEVVTLRNKNQYVSIWPGDTITALLKNGQVYTGRVEQSIEPWCITIMYSSNSGVRFEVNNIDKIEVLDYSELRPANDKGDTGIVEELKCILINKLKAVSGSYFGFVEGTWCYAKVSMNRYYKVVQYLDDHPKTTTTEVLKYLMEQPDFCERIVKDSGMCNLRGRR